MLMGIGIFYTLNWIKGKSWVAYSLSIVIILTSLGLAYPNYKKLDMSHYNYSEDYVHNLFSVVDADGVVFANWDPFYFPLNYYQFVENKRLDILAIDEKLLKRTWYVQWLKDHYPQFMKLISKEANDFLEAVRPFEDGQPYNGNFIETQYMTMINAIVMKAMESGRKVYFTYVPAANVASNYFKEPILAAYALKRENNQLTAVQEDKLLFRNLFDEKIELDRMSNMIKSYYGYLYYRRAVFLLNFKETGQSIKLLKRALQFFKNNPKMITRINTTIEKISASSGN
jgi:hypothetical protein